LSYVNITVFDTDAQCSANATTRSFGVVNNDCAVYSAPGQVGRCSEPLSKLSVVLCAFATQTTQSSIRIQCSTEGDRNSKWKAQIFVGSSNCTSTDTDAPMRTSGTGADQCSSLVKELGSALK
jgi:hypothetical protein